MQPLKVYLAGDMKSGWQETILPLLTNCIVYDPRSHDLDDPKQYTAWDLKHVALCDVVIAYMSPINPSGFGMSLEIGYAFALGKRIIFVDAIKDDWRGRYFGMHRAVSQVAGTLEEAVLMLAPATTLTPPDPVPNADEIKE